MFFLGPRKGVLFNEFFEVFYLNSDGPSNPNGWNETLLNEFVSLGARDIQNLGDIIAFQ